MKGKVDGVSSKTKYMYEYHIIFNFSAEYPIKYCAKCQNFKNLTLLHSSLSDGYQQKEIHYAEEDLLKEKIHYCPKLFIVSSKNSNYTTILLLVWFNQ